MTNPLKSRSFKNLLPYFLLIVAAIIAYKVISEIDFFISVFGWLWRVIRPFFYGFLLAFMINMPFSAICKLFSKIKLTFFRKIEKPLALILTYLLAIGVVFGLSYMAIPRIFDAISFFIINFPTYYEGALQFVEYVNGLDLFGLSFDIDNMVDGLLETLQNFTEDNLFSSINALLAVPAALFTAFIAFISSIYILLEKDNFRRYLQRFMRVFTTEKFADTVTTYTGKLNSNIRRYIRVQTIDGIILGTIATIVLFAIGSPFALLLGVMLGIVNYIPYFGSIVGTIFAVLVVAFTQGLTRGIIAAAVLIFVQQMDGNVIQPKLMGQSFKFSPLLVIISVTVGGAFAGIFGMIMAIPIAAVIKDMLESVTTHFEQKKIEIQKGEREPKEE